jgi:hypothetical protein
MSSNLWSPPTKKTLYDWKIPWHSLKPVGNDNPRHEVVFSSPDVLIEMLERGHLTGAALSDAKDMRSL